MVVLLLWVCAEVEATAKPKMAVMTPGKNNVFISNKGFGLSLVEALHLRIATRHRCGRENRWRN